MNEIAKFWANLQLKRGFSLQEAVPLNKFPEHYEGPCEGEREGAGQLVGNRDGRELD